MQGMMNHRQQRIQEMHGEEYGYGEGAGPGGNDPNNLADVNDYSNAPGPIS
jgi:hypothetical protein